MRTICEKYGIDADAVTAKHGEQLLCISLLQATDYVVLKIAEAESEQARQHLRNKYAAELEARAKARQRINELEEVQTNGK